MPNRARIHYNAGLLLQQLKSHSKAEASLLRALEIEPDSMDYLYALADHYIRRGKLSEARRFAEQMVSKHPSSALGPKLLEIIHRMLKKQSG